MDEPTPALDPKATAIIEKLISELRKSYTIIIVTHNMQQAARVSDYTAFLYEGELIEFGKTKVIFTNPKNEQTENYITGRFAEENIMSRHLEHELEDLKINFSLGTQVEENVELALKSFEENLPSLVDQVFK